MSRLRSHAIGRVAISLTAAVAALAGGDPARAQAAKGDRAFGAYLSSECVTCHQVSGRHDGIPSIVGWPERSFVEAMNEYRDKTRPSAVMGTIAARLSDDEVAALAAYFGGLTPAPQ